MKTKHYNPKKVRSVTIIKHYSPEGSTITKKHYTHRGEHPEDRIYRDREYIKRLQEHIDYVYDLLKHDLRLNEKGNDWLFDYIYNEEDTNVEFEEYLAKYNVRYDELVK